MVNSPQQSIRFHFLNSASLTNRSLLKKFLVGLFKKEGVKLGELQYIFCSDAYLLKINRQYLNHDFYTDIITFDLTDKINQGIKGEIYISIDRVRNNARQFNVSVKEELYRVIIHGALHLCGYNDKGLKETALMRKKESFYINEYEKEIKAGV